MMRRLVKMLNKQDARYLLIDEVWPENYYDVDLETQSNLIMQEIEQIRGDGSYLKWIKETGYDLNDQNKIRFLEGVLWLFGKMPEAAIAVLEETKSKYKTKQEVELALNNRIFDRKVEMERLKAKKSQQKESTFEEICIPIEHYFKKDLDRDITVSKFLAWENRMKESKKQSA